MLIFLPRYLISLDMFFEHRALASTPCTFRVHFRPSWGCIGFSWALWGLSWAILAILGPSRFVLGLCGAILGPSRGRLGTFWGPYWPVLSRLGGNLGGLEWVWAHLRPKINPRQPKIGPREPKRAPREPKRARDSPKRAWDEAEMCTALRREQDFRKTYLER